MQSGSFIEPLEGRRLLSVTPTAGGGLVVTDDGLGGASNIDVEEVSPGNVQVFVNFEDKGTYAANNVIINAGSGGDTITFKSSTVNAQIFGGNGNDHIFVTDSGPAVIEAHGGNGNDDLHADNLLGSGGNVLLDGGNGDDTLESIEGQATILAGNGKDQILLAYDSDAYVDAGNGTDAVTVTLQTDPFGVPQQTGVITSTGRNSGTIDVYDLNGALTGHDTFVNAENVQIVAPPPLLPPPPPV
jgi:hypothetical protein